MTFHDGRFAREVGDVDSSAEVVSEFSNTHTFSHEIHGTVGTVQLRYSYRIYPTPGQRQALARAFGCARVVFNDALASRRQAHTDGLPFITDGDLSKQVITEAKRRPDRAWLGQVSAVVLQQALADAVMAYRNFFASLSGKRKGPKISAPRFRSRKDNRQAIRFTKNARFKAGDKLTLPKIGDIAVRWPRPLPSDPSSVTVIKDAAGRYFASFVVEVTERPLPRIEAETGIDLGLGHSRCWPMAGRSARPGFCVGLRRNSSAFRKCSRARRRDLRTGSRPGRRWPFSMRRSPMRAGSSTTRPPCG